ncbi:Sugar phosphate isomerase/epimerase [Peptoclostridium litorale DSM 5388]|uniref:Xylose isomerase-like TIM barrel domain-containing protein n=1 Tax=Peptoclostridium litorale DSM 5388 TaxID=1121324 RepID=A0A069RGW9_PEPLI|nr:TIM barrel protein [Peptoclostridium litorale]KDR96251.1 hypothetical protein CLIT_4c00880 [Peptoclostridium litorale DSM 5388]SIO14496.1 Sugar phosphate isomerase/epimerase [Peptoclostridium litorale DSM 5388]
MNFLISINHIGFDCAPEMLVQIMKCADISNAVDGIELNVDVFCEFERAYMERMARTLKEEGMILQVHAPNPEGHFNDREKIARMLRFYNEIAGIMGGKVDVVFHPMSGHSEMEAVKNTAEYVNMLLHEIDSKGLAINPSLENLNSTKNHIRLGTNHISSIIKNSHMGLCWDIGHEVASNNHSYRLEKGLESRISNIHIHDVQGSDHCPFYHFNTDFIKAMKYLDSMGYENSVVLEINISKLNSSSLFKKYHEYVGNLLMLKNYDNPLLVDDFTPKFNPPVREVI